MFNPFNKNFRDVTREDLEKLREVQEGWYVEYKGEKPKKGLAKSIAAFANSYGGILFLGISEGKDDRKNFAEEFNGVTDSPDDIRNSVSDSIQPFPYLETFSIPVSDDKNILMIVVPEGIDTPYVHNDGCVYRRQESGSDLIKENDRHTLDMLYKKAEKQRDAIKLFKSPEVTFSKGESETPYLYIYGLTQPFERAQVESFDQLLSTPKVKELFSTESRLSFPTENPQQEPISLNSNIEFDSMNIYPDSFCLRHIPNKEPYSNGLSIEVNRYGNLKARIPLPIVDNHHITRQQFSRERTNEYITTNLTFINAEQLFVLMSIIVERYTSFLSKYGFPSTDLSFSFETLNCWRTSLYWDDNSYDDMIDAYGLPVSMKSDLKYPNTPFVTNVKKVEESTFRTTSVLFSIASSGLGIANWQNIGNVIVSLVLNNMNNTKEN